PAPARGTRPAHFWTTVADRAASAAGPVLIVYLTDGEIDDHSPEAMGALRAAIDRLAANPLVRCVALWGVTPATRAELRREVGRQEAPRESPLGGPAYTERIPRRRDAGGNRLPTRFIYSDPYPRDVPVEETSLHGVLGRIGRLRPVRQPYLEFLYEGVRTAM